jgi:hypothetical protein
MDPDDEESYAQLKAIKFEFEDERSRLYSALDDFF